MDIKAFDIKEKDPQAKQFKHINENHIITDAGNLFKFSHSLKDWMIQKPHRHTGGYLIGRVDRKDRYLHRLVAAAFIKNPENKPEVNHKDGNKKNNNVSNLEWVTSSENKKHAYNTGLRDAEELKRFAQMPKLKRRKLTIEQAREIKNSAKSESGLAKDFNLSKTTIHRIKTGEIYKEA